MAKIIIPFYGSDYSIDESKLSATNSVLASHFSTAMNGTGAKINFNGVSYNIDSTKLNTATEEIVTHLGTISGGDYNVNINGANYGISSNKISGAVSEISAIFDGYQGGGGEDEEVVPYLTFSSPSAFTLSTANSAKNWDGELEYSTDTATWNVWDGSEVSANDGVLYMRGTGNTYITNDYDWTYEYSWVINGSDVSCIGNIETLLDYSVVKNGEHPVMANYCFLGMFANCAALIKAPELPATTLAMYCYDGMFNCCTSLTEAHELPATTLAEGCYSNMFAGCTSLKATPELPATTLAMYCYQSMFYGCTSLTEAHELPATTLAEGCYYQMFNDCTSLTEVPEKMLPATTLANDCYSNMFAGCTSLKATPELPATTLAMGCYSNMFNSCTSLTRPCELNALVMEEYCYQMMFRKCSGIKLSTYKTGGYQTPYRIPTSGEAIINETNYATYEMFTRTGGTFKSSPSINTTYYLAVSQ